MSASIAVVKVGGSLFDLPDLSARLHCWLAEEAAGEHVVLVPGGGKSADVIRDVDRCHGLGEETSHWLALRVLTVNAYFLASLFPAACVTGDLREIHALSRKNRLPILDVHEFARSDEQRHDHLPHCWAVTSDALAARAAVLLQARRLVLLKSSAIAQGLDWAEAGRLGFVDTMFAEVLRSAKVDLQVRAVDLRKDKG